jgi:hypothetical protein
VPAAAPRLGILLALILVGAGSGLLPRVAASESDPPWYESITVNGFASSSYSYNFGTPDSRTNTLRVFDFDDASFKVDAFELVLQRAATKPRDAGFRADVVLGSSVPRISAAAGLFRDDAGVAGDLDLQQAFATYVAPLGSGLKLDAGKFITPFGYEVIEGYDGWNDNATRSLLFGYAIPFTHTGVRAAYAFSAKATLTAILSNGWDDARDNNRAKSFAVQLSLAPTSTLTAIVGGMTGAEQTDNDHDLRSLLDASLIWKPASRFTLGANGDWGQEAKLAAGDDAHWSGVAGYARMGPRGPFSLTVRGESFADPDGVRTGTSQSLAEITLTPEAQITPSFLLRGDLRIDHSNRPVFERDGQPSDTQSTVLLNAIVHF